MRVAHLSDLHVTAPGGVPARRLLNKRFTGWANLRLKRGNRHRMEHLRAVLHEVARAKPDHVIITGDLTNLALESEFGLARELIDRELGVDPSRVTIVPGNHDVYTRGAYRSRRFGQYFRDFLEGAFLGGDDVLPFPVVKLSGPIAFVGLASAVPRAPFVAAGEIGRVQLEALAKALARPEVRERKLVLALHHPLVHPWSRVKGRLEGLRDATDLRLVLDQLASGLVLHGHLHRRIRRPIPTAAGELQQIGATSASLHDEAPDRMAGFNVYELDESGRLRIEAAIYDPDTRVFRAGPVPMALG